MTKETVGRVVFYSLITLFVITPVLLLWAFPKAMTEVTIDTVKWLRNGKKVNWRIWD